MSALTVDRQRVNLLIIQPYAAVPNCKRLIMDENSLLTIKSLLITIKVNIFIIFIRISFENVTRNAGLHNLHFIYKGPLLATLLNVITRRDTKL